MMGLGYVRLGDHHIITGHVLEALKKIPDGKVQVCVTSPPYFGLRAYGTEPQVWGGLPDCAHEWGAESLRKGPAQKQGATSQRNGRANVDAQIQRDVSEGSYCIRCGCWRGELGQEPTPALFVTHLVNVFREVKRVLRDDGVLFVNLGDSYASKWPCQRRSIMGQGSLENGKREARPPRMDSSVQEKSLMLVPQRFVLAMSDDGWIVRDEIVWAKKSCMPESVRDRCTKSWEPVFMFTKQARYYWDAEAVKQPSVTGDPRRPHGRGQASVPGERRNGAGGARGEDGTHNAAVANLRNVWHLGPEPYAKAHFATFPTEIPRRCIKAATSEKGACSACGASWRRAMKRGDVPYVAPSELDRYGTGEHGVHRKVGGQYQKWLDANPPQTTGWQPGCSCGAEVRPCLVLDPFAGSGRTGKAARELGRRSVMIELNPEYVGYIREQVGT